MWTMGESASALSTIKNVSAPKAARTGINDGTVHPTAESMMHAKKIPILTNKITANPAIIMSLIDIIFTTERLLVIVNSHWALFA